MTPRDSTSKSSKSASLFIGNEDTISRIPPIQDAQLPILLYGPPGLGKMTYLRQHWAYNLNPIDVHAWTDSFTAQDMEAFHGYVTRPPYSDQLKAALLDLDLVSHSTIFNALLKPLEEHNSDTVKIGLTASRPIPATIRSRALKFRFYPLSDEELHTVLTKKLKWTPDIAHRAIRVANGRVDQAIEYQTLKRRHRSADRHYAIPTDRVHSIVGLLGENDRSVQYEILNRLIRNDIFNPLYRSLWRSGNLKASLTAHMITKRWRES